MRFYSLIFSILLIINSTSFAHQTTAKIHVSHSKNIKPPGTVAISENFYFDKTEISNFSWLEYMYWNKAKFGQKSNTYKSSVPDTTVWRTIELKHNPGIDLESNYLRHPKFHTYPVVGISYEQAEAYCTWRSDRVNEMLFARESKDAYQTYLQDNDKITIPQIFIYRLPTEEEWERIAIAPLSKKAIRKQKGAPAHNFQGQLNDRSAPVDGGEMTVPVNSYWQNIYGIYNAMGNVAEMVQEKGKAKGGSWFHTEQDSRPDQIQNYTGVNAWLGFRCVCEKN